MWNDVSSRPFLERGLKRKCPGGYRLKSFQTSVELKPKFEDLTNIVKAV